MGHSAIQENLSCQMGIMVVFAERDNGASTQVLTFLHVHSVIKAENMIQEAINHTNKALNKGMSKLYDTYLLLF